MNLPCPNEETCGGWLRVEPYDEWDTNAHGFDVTEQTCVCELTEAQYAALGKAAREDDWEPHEPC